MEHQSVSVTFTGDNMADVAAKAAAFFGTAAAPVDGAAASTGRGRGKGKETPPADDAPKGPTVEEIRALASGIEEDTDQDKALVILEKAGVESISGLEKKSAEVRQTVFDGIEDIIKAAKKKKSLG